MLGWWSCVLGVPSSLVVIRLLRCWAISVSQRPWLSLTPGRPKGQVPRGFLR